MCCYIGQTAYLSCVAFGLSDRAHAWVSAEGVFNLLINVVQTEKQNNQKPQKPQKRRKRKTSENKMKWDELALLSQTGFDSIFSVFSDEMAIYLRVHETRCSDAHFVLLSFQNSTLSDAWVTSLSSAVADEWVVRQWNRTNERAATEEMCCVTQFQLVDQVFMCHINIVNTCTHTLAAHALQIGFCLLIVCLSTWF